jgi:hypothetical protein
MRSRSRSYRASRSRKAEVLLFRAIGHALRWRAMISQDQN